MKNKFFNIISSVSKNLKREITIYRLLLKDKRTPLLAKVFLALAIGYFFMPFDIIPDFIPVIGHLDDAVIIPLFIFIALKLTPKDLVDYYKSIS